MDARGEELGMGKDSRQTFEQAGQEITQKFVMMCST